MLLAALLLVASRPVGLPLGKLSGSTARRAWANLIRTQSQLYYPVSTLTFGALALAWIMLCCIVALKLRLFSESYIAFGALLW